ncbi:hypothetical protein [Moorena sp. SIOASIH]|nr:hypothetical protein [Moorena sp. SIOASIH]
MKLMCNRNRPELLLSPRRSAASKPSTFNLQPSTFNLQPRNLQP